MHIPNNVCLEKSFQMSSKRFLSGMTDENLSPATEPCRGGAGAAAAAAAAGGDAAGAPAAVAGAVAGAAAAVGAGFLESSGLEDTQPIFFFGPE
jgi:hypothetical protein